MASITMRQDNPLSSTGRASLPLQESISTALRPARSSSRSARGVYRLFPSADPSASPSYQDVPAEVSVASNADYVRRRSQSLDNLRDMAAGPPHRIASRRGREIGFPLLKPMSTVHESNMDSPTVPGPIFFSPRLQEENGHNRSSSAPGQYGRMDTNKGWTPSLPALSPSSPLDTYTTDLTSIINGLGLTFDEPPLPTPKLDSKREKPNLWITVDKDVPPPPPPKSPSRHRRIASAGSTISPKPEKPTAQSEALERCKRAAGPLSAPVNTPTGVGEAGSFFSSRTDARIREVANRILEGRGRTGQPASTADGSHGEMTKGTLPATIYEGDEARKQRAQAAATSAHIVHQHSRLHSDRRLDRSKDLTDAPPPTPLKDSWLRGGSKDIDMPKPLTIHRSASRSQSRDAVKDTINTTEHKDHSPAAKSVEDAPRQIGRTQTPTPLASGASEQLDRVEQPGHSAKVPDAEATLAFSTGRTMVGKTLTEEKLANPVETLKELSAQSEALHVRYKDLRTERQKISSGLLANLKDERPSPEYVNVLLDQQLSLAAVNSAMDVCFARLKALDCRKEEAINALIGSHCSTPTSTKLMTSARSSKPRESGRSTPDFAGRKIGRFGSQLHKDGVRIEPRPPTGILGRTHSIRREVAVVDPSRSDPPISLVNGDTKPLQARDAKMPSTSRKAVQSVDISRRKSPLPEGPHRRPSRLQTRPTGAPPSRPLPSPPPSRADESVPRSAISSVSSSSENEIKTPTEEYSGHRFGHHNTRPKDSSRERKPSILQAIEVVIDDDLLSLYNGYGDK